MPRVSPPKNSMRSLQDEALKNNSIELIGEDDLEFKPIELNAIEAALYDIAIEFVLEVRKNLEAASKVSSGALADSINPESIEKVGNKITIGISSLYYSKFVDKGVKGWQKGGGNSPYQFKPPNGNNKGNKNSKFVAAIREWLIREGLTSRANTTKTKSKTSRKEIDDNTRQAIIIAANIRRRGLEPTNFWGKAEAEIKTRIKERFKKALKIDIINNTTNVLN